MEIKLRYQLRFEGSLVRTLAVMVGATTRVEKPFLRHEVFTANFYHVVFIPFLRFRWYFFCVALLDV